LRCSSGAISAASSLSAPRLVCDYDEACEITQEAFVAAWQALPGLRGAACFSTWLYLITYHCGLRQLEKRKRDTVWE
jgi:RNA polymerase sigma-70 factor (ECF subfamily)